VTKFRDVLDTLNREQLAILTDMENVNSEKSAKQVLRRMYYYLDRLVNVLHENPKVVREKIREMLDQMEQNDILKQHRDTLIGHRIKNRNNDEIANEQMMKTDENADTDANSNDNQPVRNRNQEQDQRTSEYPYRTSNYITTQLQNKGQHLNAQQANRDLNQLIQNRFNRR